MNSLVLALIAVIILWMGYAFYGRRFEKFLGIDPERPTPARTRYDGVDYVPAKHWLILFGHQFSSIAGAGPVIGPVIAVSLWGWGPAAVFVLLGTIFIGGIHDFGSFFVSIRNDGRSISDVAEKLISRRARLIFSWFVLFSLIVVVAVFIYFCSNTFIVEPKIVLPSLGLIPVAVLVGIMIYVLRVNLAVSTIVGLVSLAGLIILGQVVPIDIPGGNDMFLWTIILLVYCFIASILPVNLLLQPRDYLSSYLLFFGVAVGALGILTARPDFTLPPFTAWNSYEGGLWPMLFVTIACGAVSGFHALVSGGTTSKQIANEKHAMRIGYGAMVVEAVLAIIVIIAVGAFFRDARALNMAVARSGPINVFAEGYGYLTRFILGRYGKFIAVILLNAFILTTLDTATRIARYILQEMFGTLDRYLATILIVLSGGWIALSGEWKKIWPIFGSANQLVAALVLIVITSWFLSKNKHTKYTLIPAIFMLVTSVAALGWQLGKFVVDKDLFLAAVDIGLMVLALAMILEVFDWAVRKKNILGKTS